MSEKRATRVRNKYKYDVPLWHRPILSVAEATEYFGIGSNKIYELTEKVNCPFVIWIGSRRVIKRTAFERFLEKQYSISVGMEEIELAENKKQFEIPLYEKPFLSIEEASVYTGIGRDKLYELTNPEDCPFVLWIGNRRMIKRRVFDEYIEKCYSI